MNVNSAVASNFANLLCDLGEIDPARVLLDPKPCTATIDDLIRVNSLGALCELVDGTLVEKATGWRESLIASLLCELLRQFLRANDLGLVSGPDGFVRILRTQVRGPDVSFISWGRLPGGRVPEEKIPEMVPDLVIEVLSESNTYAEMARKRREYFHAGVRQVWMIDIDHRTVAVYYDIMKYEILDESLSLTGGEVLPGLQIPIADIFSELDRTSPK